MTFLIYKDYGMTGKKISAIGFGGMRFIKDNNKYNIDKCAEVVRTANKLGINYFDTAPHYCNDTSEEIMGYAFKDMPNEFYVSTKSREKSGDLVRRSIERSLKRLGISKITFFNIWYILSLEDYRSRMVKDGAYQAAYKAKEEGLIEHIVFSTHCNGDDIETIVKEGFFEGVTLGYNILNFPFRQKGLKAAYEHGLGVATMNPLSGGLIPQRHDYFDFIKEFENQSVVEVALKFNASHKEITTVLAGMCSIEEVIQNAQFGNSINSLNEEKLKSLKTKLLSSMDYLCTGCRYCDSCPNNVRIPELMLSYNQKTLGQVQDAVTWLNGQWRLKPEATNLCVECGKCEKLCTQHIPIVNRLREIKKWLV